MLYTLLIAAVLIMLVVFMYQRSQTTTAKTSTLDIYSKNLTALATQGLLDPVIGRSEEIDRVIQILSRRTKNNPVLIGDSGVGKTAIVEGLANAIARGEVPGPLKEKRVLALDLSGLVAGTKYRGEFEKRLTGIINEIVAAKRSIILFIDELHTLAEAGEATGAIDASDILKPALARGELQAIGATTREEYEKIRNDKTLERRFQPIFVREPTPEETVSILRGLRPRYEEHHHLRIDDEAINAAVLLAEQYLLDRHFPDKAIDVIDEAAAKVRLHSIEHPEAYAGKDVAVMKGDVESIIKQWAEDVRSLPSTDVPTDVPAPTIG
jgi:ATP-dependent Clp protease ATP-binding subunit ClpC